MRVFVLALILLMLGWAVNYYGSDDIFSFSGQHGQQRMTAQFKAGNDCVAISEQATAHFNPKLEFQRLELAGRKANVVVRCMADLGFYQNPAWVKYAEPIAAKVSSEQHISVDEALENLKRVDMLIFTPVSGKPDYWVPGKGK